MRTSTTILAAVTYCAHLHTQSFAFTPQPSSPVRSFISTTASHRINSLQIHENDNSFDECAAFSGPLGDDYANEAPRSLGPKRAFLGIRRESGAVRRLLKEQQSLLSQRVGTTTTTALSSSPSALMPDGGLSPCVIKVLGVGGGGSNAVGLFFMFSSFAKIRRVLVCLSCVGQFVVLLF